MTRRRWIADEVSGNRAVLSGQQARHLARVLRARVGQEFDIVAGGRVRRGQIAAIHPDRVEFELGQELETPALPDLRLFLSVFKFDRMEWAVEKVTELGVAAVVPVRAERSERHLCAAAAKRVERWRRIAREAAQQSRRLSPPEIANPMSSREAAAAPDLTRILAAEVESQVSLTQALQGAVAPVALAIGPEGGWTDSELERFRASGWRFASLGSTILRVETAAIAGVAIAMEALRSQ